MNMGARKTTMLVIIVTAILLTVQVSAVAGAGSDDKEPELEMRVHYLYKADAKGGVPGAPGDNAKPPKDDDGTYKTLGKGVVWKTFNIELAINPFGSKLSDTDVLTAISAGAAQWDTNTDTDLFGAIAIDDTADFDYDTIDGSNDIVFGAISDSQIIAVTYTWGYFGGPPAGREIVEFDIMFNTYYTWGDADISGDDVVDVWNIAVHEIGHGLGLADLYNDADDQETMYGYSGYGELIKRDLYKGDIAGIQSLYDL